MVVGYSFYFALLLPVALILLVNFVVLIMVMRSLIQKNNPKISSTKSGKANVRIAFTCATRLGLTWVLGLLAIREMTYSFQLLFAIFNSVQGFFVFVFYTLMNKDAQKEWKNLEFHKEWQFCDKFKSSRRGYRKKMNLLKIFWFPDFIQHLPDFSQCFPDSSKHFLDFHNVSPIFHNVSPIFH